jgi:hypothetical protein
MVLRRFRKRFSDAGPRVAGEARKRRKNNSALIFDVFASLADWRLMVFEAL